MSDALLPCPFCGHEAVMVPHRRETRAFVECTGKFAFEDGPDCGARTGYYSTEAEAAAAWNRRAPPPQPDALKLAEEALEPFAAIAEGKTIISDDDDDAEWFRHDDESMSVGDFRRAREALAAIRAAREGAKPEEPEHG